MVNLSLQSDRVNCRPTPPALPQEPRTSYLLALCSAVFRPWYLWTTQTLALLCDGNQSLFTKSMTITWFFNSVLNVLIWKAGGCAAAPAWWAAHPSRRGSAGIPGRRMTLAVS